MEAVKTFNPCGSCTNRTTTFGTGTVATLSIMTIEQLGERVSVEFFKNLLILVADPKGYKVSSAKNISAVKIKEFIKEEFELTEYPLTVGLHYDTSRNIFYGCLKPISTKNAHKLYKEYLNNK